MAVKIGGKKTPCSKEQFEQEIEERKLYARCYLEDVGGFYFVFGKMVEPNSSKRNSMVEFLAKTASAVNSLTTIHETGLSQIRGTADTDFTLECDGGAKIQVHRAVLEGLWPFFKRMMDSNMKEETQKKLKLPMPRSTLEALLRYMYGEDLDFEFRDAANLIVFAQMYDIPELLELADGEVECTPMDIGQAIYVWRKSFEAQNEDVRDYASSRREELMPEVEDFDGEIVNLKKVELIALFSDTMSARKREIS
ncbi:hypothetical protein CJU89_3777 [Yarrowia sp. B02]|nr:hypothetical protein CJU89_3777 [Yarrowia sp. B02]